MNSQIEMMKKAIDDASHEKGIQWNKVTWYSWTLAIVVFFFVIPLVAFYVGTEYGALRSERGQSPSIVGATACTEEAMICPDGTTVGRTGPKCEFAKCPEVAENGSTGTKPTPRPSVPKTPAVACTMDAKVCADGSAVGRVGPSCEFAKCPSSTGRPELKGVATLGPTCPVVDMKSGMNCKDKPYEGSLEIWTEKGGFVKSFATKIDGSFATELTPGRYVMRIPKTDRPLPTLSPIPFVMEQGKLTEISPKIDTGIR